MGKKKNFLAGYVYVESGQLYIGDPGSMIGPEEAAVLDWDEFGKRVLGDGYNAEEGDAPEGKAKEPLGRGGGIVFEPGLGDGKYPVYIHIEDDGMISGAYITFNPFTA